MRVNPSEKIAKANEFATSVKQVTVFVTRIVAKVVCFLSTFALLIKILFF